jgi:ABC-type phosphate transport system substrate-binding protein
MLSRISVLVAALLGLMVLAAPRARADDFVVVVHPSNPVDSMTEKEISALFLKSVTRWDDGRRVLPLDHADGSAIRARFSESIHGRSVSAIKNYWQQQIFAGRDVPPPEKASDREVLAYVASNPSAIGYVSSGADLGSVKVVSIAK